MTLRRDSALVLPDPASALNVFQPRLYDSFFCKYPFAIFWVVEEAALADDLITT